MPQQTIDNAKMAISAAQNAGASQYAQTEFAKAQSLMNDAMAQRQANNMIQAKSFAEQAKQQAEAALKITQQKKSPTATVPQSGTAMPTNQGKKKGWQKH